MPSQFAALICFLFIFSLFWIDLKKSQTGSRALWIPFIWMFLAGSRYISQWLNLGSSIETGDAYLEGSPVDRAIFLVLILAGIMVLARRRLQWSKLLTNNWGVWLFFIFGAISIGWSDYPDVSFKRLIKTLGTVCMALVILTEERPYEAIGIVLRRLAFILLPLSVLFTWANQCLQVFRFRRTVLESSA
jgi:exopolysaccharide production protein ExoQ